MELHGREMTDEFCLKMPYFHVTFRDLLHAVNLRHGTDGFTSPQKEGVLRIFFALKNPTASVGFEPANLGTKGQLTIVHRSRQCAVGRHYQQELKYINITFTYSPLSILTRFGFR